MRAGPLADFYLRQARPGARFAPDVLDVLVAQPWPGNIRELRNVVVQAATMAAADEITCADLPSELRQGVSALPQVAGPVEPSPNLDDMERQAILRALPRRPYSLPASLWENSAFSNTRSSVRR